MATLEDARAQIATLLNERNRGTSGPETLVIVDERTIERPWGWVFFYTSQGWRDGDPLYALGGNAPFIVDRLTGHVHSTGTARPIEFYIENYELTGNPSMSPGRFVEIDEADFSCDVAAAVKLLCKLSALTVSDAAHGLNEVRRGKPFVVRTADFLTAESLCRELRALGFACRQQPEYAG